VEYVLYTECKRHWLSFRLARRRAEDTAATLAVAPEDTCST